MDLFGQFRAADSLFRLITGDMAHVTSYPFCPREPALPGRSEPIPMSLPEEQGVPSSLVEKFLRLLEEDTTLCPHGVVILRHGERIAEAAWKPYSGRIPQMQFSLSKSVTGMAVGLAISEGLLSLDDRMREIFPEKLPPFYMGKPGDVTVRQLLTMSSGVRFNELGSVSEKDWVRAWLLSDCAFAPGSQFSYNSMNSYLLAAAVCQKAGMSLTEYLTPRLWEPLGIATPHWETCPMGIEKGGWGLYLLPGDMAKLGQLYLQNGVWKGQQVLPQSWVEEATRRQIDCRMGERDAWYGYQLWGLAWGNGYQFNGVFGQYVAVLPEQDMVVAVTSGNDQLFEDNTLRYLEECFCIPGALSDHPLPPNPRETRALRKTLESLWVISEMRPDICQTEKQQKPGFWGRWRQKHTETTLQLPDAARYNGRSYQFSRNSVFLLPLIIAGVRGNFPGNLQEVRFRFGLQSARFWFREGDKSYVLEAGYPGRMIPGSITVHGERYPVQCGVWEGRDEDGRLVVKLYLVFPETPSVRVLKLIFYGVDGEKLMLRSDERPSAARAVDMFAGLVTGGRSAEEVIPPGLQRLPAFVRVRGLLRPKAKGQWQREPQKPQ